MFKNFCKHSRSDNLNREKWAKGKVYGTKRTLTCTDSFSSMCFIINIYSKNTLVQKIHDVMHYLLSGVGDMGSVTCWYLRDSRSTCKRGININIIRRKHAIIFRSENVFQKLNNGTKIISAFMRLP